MTVDIRNLAFAYDDETVLDGVDLTAESGELLGLLGPNGSGKSTLLECCNHLLEPDSGDVSLDGDRVGELTGDERARRIGYVPQAESRAFPASVFETVLQGRRPHGGWTPSERDREAVTVEAGEGIEVPPEAHLGRWEQTSEPLTVSAPYPERIRSFREHFASEIEAIGDDELEQELRTLDTILDAA